VFTKIREKPFLIECNSKVREITGFTDADFQKITTDKMVPELQADGRTSLAHFEEQAGIVLKKGHYFVADFLMRHKDGHLIWTDMSLSKLYEDRDDIMVVQFRDVSERHQAQQAIKASEVRFRNLYENSGNATLIIELDSMLIVDCNSTFLKLSGYTQKDIKTIGPADMTPELQPDGLPSAEHMMKHIKGVQQTGYYFIENWMLQRKNGSLFYADLSLSKVYEGNDNVIVVQMRDVTKRQEVQQALGESEERFRNLFKNAAIGIGVFDIEKMIVVDCNPQYAELHGFTIAEFKKTQPQDATPAIQADGRDTMTHMYEYIEAVSKNGSHTVNNWLCKRKDGTIFNTEITLNILNEATPNVIFVHMTDITEKQKALRAVQKSEEDC